METATTLLRHDARLVQLGREMEFEESHIEIQHKLLAEMRAAKGMAGEEIELLQETKDSRLLLATLTRNRRECEAQRNSIKARKEKHDAFV